MHNNLLINPTPNIFLKKYIIFIFQYKKIYRTTPKLIL